MGTQDNNKLGTFELSGIAPAPRGVPKIEVSFDLDASGILHLTATDQATGRKNEVKITNDSNRLSKDDIERMVNDAEKYKDDDEKQRQRIEARNQLESTVFRYKQAAQDAGDKISEEDKKKVEEKCKETMAWLDNNSLADEEELKHYLDELNKECMPVMSKLYSGSQAGGCQSGGPGGCTSGSQQGPTVEEMD